MPQLVVSANVEVFRLIEPKHVTHRKEKEMPGNNGGLAQLESADVSQLRLDANTLTATAADVDRIVGKVTGEEPAPLGEELAPSSPPESMAELLSAAGRSFLRAFGSSLVVVASGWLAAPELNFTVAMATAGLIASIVAGFRAIQELVPYFSFRGYVSENCAQYLDSFARAFLAALLTSWIGILSMPTLTWDRSLVIGLMVGVGAALLRGAQAVFDKTESPFMNKGLPVPWIGKAHE
jgi:hypothetical protein